MKLTLNPGGLDDFYIPDNIQHYPIISPRIDVLVGEEANRRFSWRLNVINPTAINSMQESKKKLIREKLNELIQGNFTEAEVEQELEKFNQYLNFEWKDIREKHGNILLKHYIKELNVHYKFSEGLRDALITGEEGYLCDIINGDVYFEKLNPLKTYVLQHGYSNRYEDAAVIVIDDYWSPGRVVDTYYQHLTEKDNEYILNSGYSVVEGGRDLDGDLFKEDIDDRDGIELKRQSSLFIDDYLDVLELSHEGFVHRSNYFDTAGNIRVLRVFWRSYKLIKKVKYYDSETGKELIKYRNENYKPDKNLGEEAENLWISEWWQGVKLGKEVYIQMNPRPVQYSKLNNPGYNSPGITGRVYNTNDQKAVSLLDKAKVFNYLFNGGFHRITEAWSKYFGPILEIDKAKMPENWDITKTLYFAKKAGILLVDSFKEGKKGSSTGKLAGAVGNTSGKVYNADIANYIQQNINIMEYALAKMDEITGVPKQRLGNVEKRETVGGVDTAIRQGNYVTETIFKTHELVKKEALNLLFETIKIAVKDNKIKLSNIGDDLTNQIVEIDGDNIKETEYGLIVENNEDNIKLEQNLNQLAHAALQNQMLSFSTIMKIYTSPSLIEIQRLIEKDERDFNQRQQEAAQAQQEAESQKEQLKTDLEYKKLELEKYSIDTQNKLKELELLMKDKDDVNPIEYEKLKLDYKKHLETLEQNMIKLDQDMQKHRDKLEIENKKLKKVNQK